MATIKIFDKVEIYITRPSGESVTAVWGGSGKLNDNMFMQIKKATFDANGSVVTGYKNLKKAVEAPKMDDYDRAVMDSIAVNNMSRMGE
ncbi:MAG: hypothetical protein V3S16_14190 [Candidatus Desulfatibia sp.]|uniref:hypothetical protein n=1 Tax=Candidatus Desulfatibia sp. TaxID=3101189 RepID=UPI002F3156C2